MPQRTFLSNNAPRVLAIGAHPDDIEYGAAGVLYRMMSELSADVTMVVLTPGRQHTRPDRHYDELMRRKEAANSARQLTIGHTAADITLQVLDYEDCNLHRHVHELIREIERRLLDDHGNCRFDIIMTHARGDTHNDHRQVYEATISAARAFGGMILLYQSPSTIPNEFRPTLFVSLDQQALDKKTAALAAHESQQEKNFTSREWIETMARYWGFQRRMPDKMFEAFELHQAFWDF